MRFSLARTPLTLVLIAIAIATITLYARVSLGAKRAPSPDFDERATEEAVEVDNDLSKIETVDMAEPPPPTPGSERPQLEYFHRHRRGLTFRIGQLFDSKPDEGKASPTLLGGTQFLFATSDLRAWEAGADLFADGNGALHFARRYIHSRTSFRPYTKIGIGVRVVPEDKLVTLIKYDNYQVRTAAGFEYHVQGATSARLEIEGALSARQIQGSITVGVVQAW